MSSDFYACFESFLTIHLGEQWSYALSPDGRTLATGGLEDRTLRIWDLQTGKLVNEWTTAQLSGHRDSDRIYCLTISSDGKTLVSGGSLIQAWDLASGKKIRTFKGGGWANSLVLTPDGVTLVTAFEHLIFWNFQTGKKICKLRACMSTPLLVDSTSQYLIGVDYALELGATRSEKQWKHQIKVWDLMTGRLLRSMENRGIETDIYGLALSPDEQLLAGSKIDGIWIWDLKTGQQIQRVEKYRNVSLHKHLDTVYSLIFSSDGKSLLSTGADGLIQAWDVESGKHIGTIEGQRPTSRLLMSKDAQTLVGIEFNGPKRIAQIWRRHSN